MATQNLFEKYGIKEVADVTFYRIEKKEETFEAQREISVSSILKGALETRTVYPMSGGQGSEDGFEALVFTDADIITGTNYDCDDTNDITAVLRVTYQSEEKVEESVIETAIDTDKLNLVKASLGETVNYDDSNIKNVEALSFIDYGSKAELSISSVKKYDIENISATKIGSEGADTIKAETTVYDPVENSGTKEYTLNVVKGDGTLTLSTSPSDTEITFTLKSENESIFTVDNDTQIITAVADGSAKLKIDLVVNDTNGNRIGGKSISSLLTVKDGEFTDEFSEGIKIDDVPVIISYTYTAISEIVFTATNSADSATGIYAPSENLGDESTHWNPDADLEVGTHEYTYEQQVCILFARRQNLISKKGVRYQFTETDTMFGEITFNDNFAAAPHSTEKVVIAGLAGKFTDGTYDLDEIQSTIKGLTQTYSAKAYDVVYDNYAELVVEDEMGYYNPAFLGYEYERVNGKGVMTSFTNYYSYAAWSETSELGRDAAIAFAKMWEDGVHYSINDAIDALRQKQKILDRSEPNGIKGINSIFGGYKVSSNDEKSDYVTDPEVGHEDTDEEYNNIYKYSVDGETITSNYSDNEITSKYPLDDVNEALTDIAMAEVAVGRNLRVDYSPYSSNRAIYVRVDGSVDTAAGAYIYLLHNKNYKKLSLDEEGIFQFEDKKGNTLYYQDKIFKGIEYLALVILGTKGLIFVVNRHGNTDLNKIAWMVNDNGYVNDTKAKTLVRNGLIHTTDVTVNDETFEATCTVKELKVHKTTKKTNRYVPVLFLDTLKISTIEQTAEEVYATGGRGNANLIGWDYGKEITLTLQDALFTPASMSAIFGSYEGNDFRKGVKETKSIDRFEKVVAKRSFIVPAGNMNGTPSEADKTAQAVFYDPATMEPYPDGTPIAEGEIFLKYTRSIAYEGQSIGHTIEISADKFPGTYKVVGDTYVRSKETGEDERFQFIIPQAKMTSEQTITLEADGDPTVFDMNMTVLRPEDGVMVRFVQYNVVENEEENDGSTMVKNTENLNLLDDAELFKVSADGTVDDSAIGATEY